MKRCNECYRDIFILFWFLILSLDFCAQNENKKWFFGQQAGIDFMTSPPTPFVTGPVTARIGGSASVADAFGNLLFYTDGNTIWNRNHVTMANGIGLNSDAVYQRALIVKRPGSANIYYVFTTLLYHGVMGGGAYCTEIDMSLAAGMGSVTTKNTVLFGNVPGSGAVGKITGTKHCNGNDIWVLFQVFTGGNVNQTLVNSFQAFLVTASGVNFTPTVSSSPLSVPGSAKISPNGKKLGMVDYSPYAVYLFDFDNSTGVISNMFTLAGHGFVSGYGEGCEFSPNSSKFYAARSMSNTLRQWDLCAGSNTAIANSMTNFTVSQGFKGQMQLAPDGKVYLEGGAQTQMGVINNPNLAGTSCNLANTGFTVLTGTPNEGRLVNFIGSYFYEHPSPPPITNSVNTVLGCRNATFTAPPQPSVYCAAAGYSITHQSWDFGDPASGSANTSTVTNPSHLYSSTGTFTAQLFIHYSCGGGTDTLKHVISIVEPTLTIGNSPVTCSTLGSATVNTNGGVGPFTYTWIGTTQTSTIANNLNAGIYTVSVFDAGAGCTTNGTTTVINNYVITNTITTARLLCHNDASGGASIIVNGGSGNYNYNWSGTTQTGSVVTGLQAGVYTVSVTDQTGPCSITETLQITQPNVLSLNLSASSLSTCVGNNIGLNAFGVGGTAFLGTGAYSYSWTNGPNTGNFNLTEAVSGTYVYTASVQDSNACVATQTISLFFTNAPVLTISTATICAGETATLTVAGATSYTWHPGGQVGNTFTANPSQTSYYSIAAFSLGCVATSMSSATITVVPPPSLTVALSSSSLCFQAFNGSANTITLSSSGAHTYTLFTPDMTGSGSPSGPSSTVSTMPPYSSTLTMGTATIIGSNGVCSRSATASFSIIPNPTVVISPTPAICAGENYTYTSYGANSYVWTASTPNYTTYHNGGIAVAHPSINSVFSVYGSSLGCNSASKTSTLTVFPLPEINFSPHVPIICLNKKITLTAIGTGTSFEWFPAEGLNNTVGMSVIASPLQTKNYSVVASANNCTNTANITVTVLALPQPTIESSKPKLCLDEIITLRGEGGKSYDWFGPQNLFYQGQEINFRAASTQFSGDYTLTVTDENGCKGNTVTSIVIQASPQGHLEGYKEQVCVPYCGDFNFSGMLLDSELTSTWQIGNQIISNNRFSHCFSEAGTYTISGRIFDAKTTCSNSVSYQINVNSKPQADFYFSPLNPVEGIDEVVFTNVSAGEDQNKWNWFFNDEYKTKFQSKNISYKFENSGLFTIAMVVTNKWNCADTAVRTIQVETDFGIYIPNAFTPNNDGLNDEFKPVIRSASKYNLKIFDRWGHLIFESTEIENGWDGTNRGGANSKSEVYMWRIELTSSRGATKSLTGHVTVVK